MPPRVCKKQKCYHEMSDQDIEDKFQEEQHPANVDLDPDTEEEEEGMLDSDTVEGHRVQRSMPDDGPDEEMILTDFGPLTMRAFLHQLNLMERFEQQPVRGGHDDAVNNPGNNMVDGGDGFVFQNPEETIFPPPPRRKLTKKKRKRSE